MNSRRRVRNSLYILVYILTILLCPKYKTWGAAPPPPTNQLIGIVDSIFQNPVEADCRGCHKSGLPDRHHLLVGSVIPGGTGAPYECLSCHGEDISSGSIVFLVDRDCLVCHIFIPYSQPSTPHHITQDSSDRHCSRCHGSVVQDFDDEHYIPDYDISAVTPDPACKTRDGPICISGGCRVCHTEDSAAAPPVSDTAALHHSARFDCAVCHNPHGNIRDCEACHAPDSLHNIQADSDNPDNPGIIIPGEENPGWGHIGNSWDCFGCHESFNGASTPQSGPTIPSVSGMSSSSVTAGIDTQLDIYGNGFINETGGITFLPDVVVQNRGSAFILDKNSLKVNSIGVTIPSTLPVGIYDLRVVKNNKLSNKKIISVIPDVVITDITCSNKKGLLTITGSGFGEKPAGTDEHISVRMNEKNQNIIFWSDTKIKSAVSGCDQYPDITVNALMGSAGNGSSQSGKTPKPCKGKSCN